MQVYNLLKFSLLGILLLSPSVNAQPIPTKKSVVLFQDLTLTPKFTHDPQVLQGISGGGEATTKISGRAKTETGECIGFVDALPDHKLTLTGNFKFLNLKVLSPGDTVLLIKGPGGSWCSDDTNGRNPAIAGEWLKGTYEIWIGSYDINASYPYLLQVTEKP
ncbi:hypothetical protein Syn7502_01914 [Synechococcus sp. PCC 7502]|uniref:hypothetical protein n=1 Tax=Synechococcus sp. PCC 7502 TaxID=1173263 RepID=UPI00029FD48D|nr:hypothetical protein [Synechococcus sp. PCC 7502]AFY73946.1 hypothetical protein Syn7502_01914 [Synechococcus sp. PCC 7502]